MTGEGCHILVGVPTGVPEGLRAKVGSHLSTAHPPVRIPDTAGADGFPRPVESPLDQAPALATGHLPPLDVDAEPAVGRACEAAARHPRRAVRAGLSRGPRIEGQRGADREGDHHQEAGSSAESSHDADGITADQAGQYEPPRQVSRGGPPIGSVRAVGGHAYGSASNLGRLCCARYRSVDGFDRAGTEWDRHRSTSIGYSTAYFVLAGGDRRSRFSPGWPSQRLSRADPEQVRRSPRSTAAAM